MISLTLAWPWVWLALPLPWLVNRYLPSVPGSEGAALRWPVPWHNINFNHTSTAPTAHGLPSQWLWCGVIWLLLLLAASRPQWLDDTSFYQRSGRDLIMAVDISESMIARDMVLDNTRYSRLTAVKKVAEDFLRRRQGDRVGLILFGSQAFVQVPLTFDLKTVQWLLEEAQIGLAGERTALGDAIGLAVKRLQTEAVAGPRVLILMTDGRSNAGVINPTRAAALAKQYDLVIYTIGIGAEAGYLQDTFSNNRGGGLDETTLKTVASQTGGQYFRAYDGKDLQKIYQQLDALQPIHQETPRWLQVRAELYPWPLGLAWLLLLIWQGSVRRQWRM